MVDTFKCSVCRETKAVTPGCTTGYGKDNRGRKVCFACCGERDRKFMVDKGVNTLYLTLTSTEEYEIRMLGFTPSLGRGTVGNWPATLLFQVNRLTVGRHNIAGKRYDVWFNGPDGHVWHGVTYGDNTQICHCKRTKQKAA